jgi:hypothetical protein
MPDITGAVLFGTEVDTMGRFAIASVEQQQTDSCGMPTEDREIKRAASFMHPKQQRLACFKLDRRCGFLHSKLPVLHDKTRFECWPPAHQEQT